MPLLFKHNNSGHYSTHPSFNNLTSTLINNNSFTNNANNHQQKLDSKIIIEQTNDKFKKEIKNFKFNFQTFIQSFNKYYKKWHLKHLFPLIIVIIYMFFGAIFFLYFEKEAENEQILKR